MAVLAIDRERGLLLGIQPAGVVLHSEPDERSDVHYQLTWHNGLGRAPEFDRLPTRIRFGSGTAPGWMKEVNGALGIG